MDELGCKPFNPPVLYLFYQLYGYSIRYTCLIPARSCPVIFHTWHCNNEPPYSAPDWCVPGIAILLSLTSSGSFDIQSGFSNLGSLSTQFISARFEKHGWIELDMIVFIISTEVDGDVAVGHKFQKLVMAATNTHFNAFIALSL